MVVAGKYFVCIRCTILFRVVFQKLGLLCTHNFLPYLSSLLTCKAKICRTIQENSLLSLSLFRSS